MMPGVKVGLNSLWLLLARIGPQALAMVMVGAVARGLGEAGLGQYAFIAALVFIGNAFTTFGTDTLLIREVARTRGLNHPTVPASLWIQLALSATWVGGVMLAGGSIPNKTPAALMALKIYNNALITITIYTVFSSLLRAYERMDWFFLLALTTATLQSTAAIWVLRVNGDLLTLVVLLVMAHWVGAGLAGIACALGIPGLRPEWSITRKQVSGVIRAALPFAMLATIGILSQRLGLLVLSTLMGDTTTGWFSAAARVVEGLKAGHYAVFGALLPALSRLQGPGSPGIRSMEVGRGLLSTAIGLTGLAIALAAVFAWLAGPVVHLLFGNRFDPSVGALRVLAWTLIPYTLSAGASLWLVTLGAEVAVVKGTLFGMLLSLGLYLVLIPRFGLLGACAAALLGECLQAGAFAWLARGHGSLARRMANVVQSS